MPCIVPSHAGDRVPSTTAYARLFSRSITVLHRAVQPYNQEANSHAPMPQALRVTPA